MKCKCCGATDGRGRPKVAPAMKKIKMQIYIPTWFHGFLHALEGTAGDALYRAGVSYFGLEKNKREAENEALQDGFE